MAKVAMAVAVQGYVGAAPVERVRDTQGMSQDGVNVTVSPSGSITVTVDGIPFSSGSSVFVVDPKWVEHYYGYDDDPKMARTSPVRKSADGAQAVETVLRGARTEFEGTQRVEVLPGRKVRVSVDTRLTTLVDARIEHTLGSIRPMWLTGCRFEATDFAGKKMNGTIPTVALYDDTPRCTVARGFRSMTVDTRMGPLEIRTTGDFPFSLLDYRQRKWSEVLSVFWFGMLETPLKTDGSVKYGVEIAFPPKRGEGTAAAIELAPKPSIASLALKPDAGANIVIPTPKKISWKAGSLALRDGALLLAEAANEADREAAAELAAGFAEELSACRGVRLAVSSSVTTDARPTIRLRIGGTEPKHPEGYRVRIGETALIEAPTTAGLVNGVKTLRQLVRTEEGGCSLRHCEIEDWPVLPFRGIQFFTGHNARDIQVRMVREILGAFKINALAYHCSFMEWDSHPELNHPRVGMKKADAQAVLDEARRQHIEVIPYVPTYGLREWAQHDPALLANPELGNPVHPKTRAICEDICREALAMFGNPRFFLIGHDEIGTSTEVLAESIRHYTDFLRGLGCRAMVWGDQFLFRTEGPDAMNAPTQEEAIRRRSLLPRDVVVCDWHYATAEPDKYVSLGIFNDLGLDTIACPWNSPGNLVNYARAAVTERGKTARAGAPKAGAPGRGETIGVLQTTWAGWSFDETSLDGNLFQYASYVLGAEAAWTGGSLDPDKVPFDYYAEFVRRWTRDVLPERGAGGWVCDLSPVANFALKAKAGEPWLGFPASEDMRALPVGEQWLGRFRFRLAGSKGEPRAVMLDGKFLPGRNWPKSLGVPVGRKASAVTFAVAATFAGPPDPAIARTTVTFEDGSTATLNWKMGENVFAIDDVSFSAFGPVIWEHKVPGKAPRVLHAYTWVNPKPEQAIRRIDFKSTGQGSSLMLFGISGIE
jgi:hypothetical protein